MGTLRALYLFKMFVRAKTQRPACGRRRKELTPWRTTFSGEEPRINPFAAWRLCAHYTFLKCLFAQRPAAADRYKGMIPQLQPKTKNEKSMEAIELPQVFGITNYFFVV